MRIENAFDVAAEPAEVYALMLDPARVAPCIPGAEVVGERDDGSYDARVTVKLGPVKMSYAGVVSIVEHDDAKRTAALRARGSEARGQGNVDATMYMAVAAGAAGGSHVDVATEMQVTGRVAQMGLGVMQDVAERMIGEMARNMEAMLTAPRASADAAATPSAPAPSQPEARPIQGFSLMLKVLGARLRRLFTRSRS